MSGQRPAVPLWASIIVPMWGTFAYCFAWEPIVFDAWSLRLAQRVAPTTSLERIADFASYTYQHGNPRLGQVLSLVLYTPGPWHVVASPLALLSMFYLATTIVLARWPSWRRADDAIAFLVTTTLIVVTFPHLGPMLFYRPYLGNYTIPIAIYLGFLVPYRFAVARPVRRTSWFTSIGATLALAVLGALAGLCNEHTGFALIALALGATVYTWRRDGRIAPWMIAAIVGLTLGYVALLLAPGQSVRYRGLANQDSVLERVVSHPPWDFVAIVGRLALHVAIAAPLCALGFFGRQSSVPLARETRLASLGLVAAGVLATLALLASPKVGERLYAASTAWIAIAIAPWLLANTQTPRRAKLRNAACALVLVFVAAQCIHAHRVIGPASEQRVAALDGAGEGSHITVAPLPRSQSWWNLGDDLADPRRRASLAQRLGLASIDLAAQF